MVTKLCWTKNLGLSVKMSGISLLLILKELLWRNHLILIMWRLLLILKVCNALSLRVITFDRHVVFWDHLVTLISILIHNLIGKSTICQIWLVIKLCINGWILIWKLIAIGIGLYLPMDFCLLFNLHLWIYNVHVQIRLVDG